MFIDWNLFWVLLFLPLLCLLEFIDWERALWNLGWVMVLLVAVALGLFEAGKSGLVQFAVSPWRFWGVALATTLLLGWYVRYVLPDRPLPLRLQRVLRAARFYLRTFARRWLYVEQTKRLCWAFWHQP